MPEAIETTATENGRALATVDAQPPVEYAPVSLFGTTSPADTLAKATIIAKTFAPAVEQAGLILTIKGKKYILAEGWNMLASFCSVTAVPVEAQRLDEGWLAKVEARTLDGRVIGAAFAIADDKEGRDSFSPSGTLGMAQTRAGSRALKGPLGFIAHLAGFESTPADEMPRDTARPAPKATSPTANVPRVSRGGRASAQSKPPTTPTQESTECSAELLEELINVGLDKGKTPDQIDKMIHNLHGRKPEELTTKEATELVALLRELPDPEPSE